MGCFGKLCNIPYVPLSCFVHCQDGLVLKFEFCFFQFYVDVCLFVFCDSCLSHSELYKLLRAGVCISVVHYWSQRHGSQVTLEPKTQSPGGLWECWSQNTSCAVNFGAVGIKVQVLATFIVSLQKVAFFNIAFSYIYNIILCTYLIPLLASPDLNPCLLVPFSPTIRLYFGFHVPCSPSSSPVPASISFRPTCPFSQSSICMFYIYTLNYLHICKCM